MQNDYKTVTETLKCINTNRHCIETTGRIELVFGTGASFHLSYCVRRKSWISFKNNDTSLRNCVQNSGLRKIRYGKSIVSSTKVIDARVG